MGRSQKGGVALEAMMTQFVAGASRVAPVAVALGYKMYKGSRRNKTRRRHRVKSHRK
jgi:hypothetical protein